MRPSARVALVALLLPGVIACAQPTPSGEPEPSTIPSTSAPSVAVVSCEDIDVPHAPADWYAATPIYVGNEMPIDQVRVFAQTLDGFRDVWIDRAHNGWIGVGFDGVDIEAQQALLKAEFPGVGVVAVEIPYTPKELDQVFQDLQGSLPAGMEPASIYEVQGYVEIWVGRLTPENIAAVSEVVDGAPVCISGQDPTTTPADGPQPEGGDGWMYLAEADTMLESELPRILAEARSLATVWTQLGLEGNPPVVDFDRQLVFYLVIGHSGSCPDTRLDDVSIDGDHVYAVIPTITDAMGCTSDWVPRTYLAAVDRDRLPAPPFQVTAERQYGARVKVTADLRVPGSVPAPGEVSPAEVLPVREPTPMPYWIETDFPWPMTIDPTCGVDYLGQINHVHWHRAEGSGMPEAWKVAIIDGLLDVELMMTPGPEPTLTASTGGVEVLYLPGPETQPVCN